MLTFFVMILCFLSIVGVSLFHLTKENVYQDTWSRMEGYAQSIRKNALRLTTNENGQTQIVLDAQELRDSEMVLENMMFILQFTHHQIKYFIRNMALRLRFLKVIGRSCSKARFLNDGMI